MNKVTWLMLVAICLEDKIVPWIRSTILARKSRRWNTSFHGAQPSYHFSCMIIFFWKDSSSQKNAMKTRYPLRYEAAFLYNDVTLSDTPVQHDEAVQDDVTLCEEWCGLMSGMSCSLKNTAAQAYIEEFCFDDKFQSPCWNLFTLLSSLGRLRFLSVVVRNFLRGCSKIRTSAKTVPTAATLPGCGYSWQ